VAVLTVARDEAAMLPRWVRWYGSQVGVENLVVVDDNTTDGSTDGLPCPVLRIPGFAAGEFEQRRIALVSGLAQGLLQSYDWVVFTDVDEFLVPDPAHHADLPAYLEARAGQEVLAGVCLNVLHVPGVEPEPLRDDLPVLGQRSFAKFVPVMCKPSVKRVPAAWSDASHGVAAPFGVDPELFLVHLKFADVGALERVAQARHELATADGRGIGSSWQHPGAAMAAMVAAFIGTADPAAAREFDPATVDLSGIVKQRGSRRERIWRAGGRGQVGAMVRRPLVRVPQRLHGLR
jgi:hypothetical protein